MARHFFTKHLSLSEQKKHNAVVTLRGVFMT